jgi:hypothetical protein
MYVMDIYTTLLSLDISWEQFEDIGWYKVAILLPVLKANPENLKEWVEKAKGSNSITLQAAVKQALKPDTDEKKPVSDIVTKTFKLHPDQKEIVEQALSLAKQKSGTAVDTGSLSN